MTNLEFDEGELRTKISKSHDGDILRIEKMVLLIVHGS